MGDASKKISFGFSKMTKKTLLSKPVIEVKQYITCVEDKSIKLVHEEPQEQELIIPMLNGNSLTDSIAEAVKRNRPPPEEFHKEEEVTKEPPKLEQQNGVDRPPETLDQMAAREILEDLKKAEEKVENDDFSVPLTSQAAAQKESTLEDYENVPIEKFGVAMLRGMGWKPDKGIGKSEKIVMPSQPTLRPKGMGLGADKVVKKEQTTAEEIQLPLIKGAFIKVINGPHKNLYGTVEGFDETAARVMIRMTLSNSVISFSEFMVQTIPKKEFDMNSKVLNIKKYDDYKSVVSSEVKVKIEKLSPSRGRSPSPQKLNKTTDYRGSKQDSKYWSGRKRNDSDSADECYVKSRRSRSPDIRKRSPLSRDKKKKHRRKRDSSDSDTSRRHKSRKSCKKDRSNSDNDRHSRKIKKSKKSRRKSSSGSSDREYTKSQKGKHQ